MGSSPSKRGKFFRSKYSSKLREKSLESYIQACNIHIVSPEELELLISLYEDLAQRSDGETIDKLTFLQFCHLPVISTQGLLGERLFEKFDRTKRQAINLEEFLIGISICCKGTDEMRYQFLFSIYDLREDGYIDKEELITMLHNTYIETITDTTPLKMPTSLNLKELSLYEIKSPKRKPDVRSFIKRKTLSCLKTDRARVDVVKNLADEILDKYDFEGRGILSYEQFRNYLITQPSILKSFSQGLQTEIWSPTHATTTQFELSPEIKPKCKQKKPSPFCGLCVPKTSKSRVKKSFSFVMKRDSQSFGEMCGYVYLKNKHTKSPSKKWAVLNNSILMIYHDSEDTSPENVIFLEGCYIDSIEDHFDNSIHGISISHQNERFKEIYLWLKVVAERNEWQKRLQKAAHSKKFEDSYILSKRLGHGKFSDVYECIEKANKDKWAVKVVKKANLNLREQEMLRSEISIMRLIEHPHIVKLKEVFDSKQEIKIVMELMEGGELYDKLVRKRFLSEYSASYITKQILEVISYLHEVGIIHRDIKPENILLNSCHDIPIIKLADFGLSKLATPNERLTLPCGTLAYVAPEVLQTKGYNREVDMWSIGTVVYVMLRGKLPFYDKDRQVLIHKVTHAQVDFSEKFWDKLTPYAVEFLKKLLVKDPEKRYTADQALQDPWIKNADILIPRPLNRSKARELGMDRGTTNPILHTLYEEKTEIEENLSSSEDEFWSLSSPHLVENLEPSNLYIVSRLYEDSNLFIL
jgi:serine/threonine protein kinase/Ca2+-binding EF-hand superfamily protein